MGLVKEDPSQTRTSCPCGLRASELKEANQLGNDRHFHHIGIRIEEDPKVALGGAPSHSHCNEKTIEGGFA